ncbi:MAG: aspartate/glutamate racemase family protein [Mycetocola sp.]
MAGEAPSRTLTWLEATPGDPAAAELWEFLADSVATLAGGRIGTRVQHTAVAAGGIRTPATRAMSDAVLVASAMTAQQQGDVLVFGCWGSPVRAARSAVGVPVTGLAEGSCAAIPSLASSAVVVTVAPTLCSPFEAEVRGYGAAGWQPQRAVRSYAPESTLAEVCQAIQDPGPLIDRFDLAAREAVADGADSVVVGCGYLAPIFTAHGYTAVRGHPDVPVLDCNRLAMEHALHLLALSDAGIGPSPLASPRPSGGQGQQLKQVAALLAAG